MNQYIEEFPLFFQTGIPSNILFPSLAVACIALVFVLWRNKKNEIYRSICWILLAEYIFVVICSTIVCRVQLSTPKIQMLPFWTYRAVINHTLGVSVWDIILNTFLFVPLGLFVSLLNQKMPIRTIALIGLLLSISIETSQYIWMKGICQFDDLMHNTIGCVLGCFLVRLSKKLRRKRINI